mgnify:FL=1
MDKIQSYINENIFSIGSKTSAREAANTMLDNSITSLLVKEENKYVGIVTHRDISEKVVAQGLDPSETKLASIMTSPLITLDASLPMNEALLSMKKNQIRHIVATVNGEVAGIISTHDLVRFQSLRIADSVFEFWSNSEVLLNESTFKFALDKLLSAMRNSLGDPSKTGRAIKDEEPLPIIAQYAIDEGLSDFADILKLSIS